MRDDCGMDWKKLIASLEAKGLTPSAIAKATGMCGASHVCNLKSGLQKTVTWERGQALIALNKATRRKPRKAKA